MSLPKLTPDRAARIIAYVRAGSYKGVAARACGIDYSTLKRWVERGSEANAPKLYREFALGLAEADALDEIGLVGGIHVAALDPKHWQAAAWLLSRKHPDRYKPPTNRVETKSLDAPPTPADALKEAEDRAGSYVPPPAES